MAILYAHLLGYCLFLQSKQLPRRVAVFGPYLKSFAKLSSNVISSMNNEDHACCLSWRQGTMVACEIRMRRYDVLLSLKVGIFSPLPRVHEWGPI